MMTELKGPQNYQYPVGISGKQMKVVLDFSTNVENTSYVYSAML